MAKSRGLRVKIPICLYGATGGLSNKPMKNGLTQYCSKRVICNLSQCTDFNVKFQHCSDSCMHAFKPSSLEELRYPPPFQSSTVCLSVLIDWLSFVSLVSSVSILNPTDAATASKHRVILFQVVGCRCNLSNNISRHTWLVLMFIILTSGCY